MAIPHLDELGDRLGIVLRNPEAIRQALVHSSFHNENPRQVAGHNERLEFLGDAVIGLVVIVCAFLIIKTVEIFTGATGITQFTIPKWQ